MAMGKQIGEFSLQNTSMRMIPGDGVNYGVEGNFRGPVTGEMGGTALVSLSGEGDANSGSFEVFYVIYLDGGGTTQGTGSGTYQLSSSHKWQTRGINRLPDGRTLAVEGEIDLASDSWSGTIFDWS